MSGELSEYAVHELLRAHVEVHSSRMAPAEIIIPQGHAEIPPGTYRLSEDGLWVADAEVVT